MMMRRVGRFLVALTVTAVLAAACGHPQTPQPGGGTGGTSGATTPGQGPVTDAGNAVEGGGTQSPVPLGLSPDRSNVKYCSLPGVPDDQEDMDIYGAHGGGGTTPAVLLLHG